MGAHGGKAKRILGEFLDCAHGLKRGVRRRKDGERRAGVGEGLGDACGHSQLEERGEVGRCLLYTSPSPRD